jgi:hypothetical protein
LLGGIGMKDLRHRPAEKPSSRQAVTPFLAVNPLLCRARVAASDRRRKLPASAPVKGGNVTHALAFIVSAPWRSIFLPN